MWFLAIFAGVFSVLAGILILRRELNSAVRSVNKREYDGDIRRELDELNSSFFDIANDLEGKYSVHEKQIQDIEFILHEYTNKQIDRMRSGRRISEKTQVTPVEKSGEHAAGEQSEQLVSNENISRDKIIARDAEALLGEGHSIQETAKRLGVSVSALRLILGVNENRQ